MKYKSFDRSRVRYDIEAAFSIDSSYFVFISLKRTLNSSRVICPSPSVSSFFISASNFFLDTSPVNFVNSSGSIEPELSLSID